jgi:tetratricopeptide (TPR) repeat protein
VSVSLNRVGNIARRRGNLEEAEAAYRESLEIDRKIREATGDTPEALHDVSVSLNKVGSVALQRGNLKEAETAFKESLLLWQRLVYVLPGTPNYEEGLEQAEEALRRIREGSR